MTDKGDRYPLVDLDRLQADLLGNGRVFVPRVMMAALLPPIPPTVWAALAGSWNDLGPDEYMADGGRYRKRRHAVFALSPDGLNRQAHQPHYQSLDYNTLNGGIERWFEPVTSETEQNEALCALMSLCTGMFPDLPGAQWRVEMHQFRIEPSAGETGQPTPEGMHRDGVDWVAVFLVDRVNVAEGVTDICNADGQSLGSFVLTQPLDTVFVDDHRVLHGVTPIHLIDADKPGHRDVLVITFKRL